MRKILESSILAANLSKTLVYSVEYRMMFGLSKIFSPFVQPPRQEKDKQLINHLRNKVIKIHQREAKNIVNGIYPAEVLVPKSPQEHIKNLPHLLLDSLKVSRRRRLNLKDDLENTSEVGNAPDYFRRNFHFQTDGYFSESSANLYEHQVEVLFSGTAAPMRRILIEMIKKRMNINRPLKVLEIGAGVGTATIDFSKSFDFESFVVSDISDAYLNVAQKRLGSKFEFVKAAGEALPFQDNQFDLVLSVYLFHELPRSVREKVLSESARVLRTGGMLAICDSIQVNDDPIINPVLENFPKDYHEPFYKDYTLWDTKLALESAGLREVHSDHELLSKYWTALK